MTVLGCELRYLRTGLGRTVVLLHTLRTQLEIFLPLIAELGFDFEVIAPDLPGHGRAAAPRVGYTAAYFTDVMEEFLEIVGIHDAILVGESIGASIALGLAARRTPQIARVIAINPYDYGRGGGIRRSSTLANVLIRAMTWPVVGEIVLSVGTKDILRRVMEGGLHQPRNLPPVLLDELWQCGKLPGHGYAFLSLCREWRSWIAARATYPEVKIPVTLVYGEDDWSRPEEREANSLALATAVVKSLGACGHFASLDQPLHIADIVREESRQPPPVRRFNN